MLSASQCLSKRSADSAVDYSPTGSSGDWIFDAKRSGDVIVDNRFTIWTFATGCCSIIRKSSGFRGTLVSPNIPPGRTTTDAYRVNFEYPGGLMMSFTQLAFHPAEMPTGGEQTWVYGSDGSVVLETGMIIRAISASRFFWRSGTGRTASDPHCEVL